VTDTQNLTAPDAAPRHLTRWPSVASGAFALAIIFGGADLVTGMSASSGRIVVIIALAMAFLLFALVGAGILPGSSNQPAIAGIGVVVLAVALAVSWSGQGNLPGLAKVMTTSNESICGDITSMDHDFLAITEQTGTTHRLSLVPVASVKSITGVEHC
jgi:hypothetical protein